jgi:hypothetical protein
MSISVPSSHHTIKYADMDGELTSVCKEVKLHTFQYLLLAKYVWYASHRIYFSVENLQVEKLEVFGAYLKKYEKVCPCCVTNPAIQLVASDYLPTGVEIRNLY